jgi:hypothetical protein
MPWAIFSVIYVYGTCMLLRNCPCDNYLKEINNFSKCVSHCIIHLSSKGSNNGVARVCVLHGQTLSLHSVCVYYVLPSFSVFLLVHNVQLPVVVYGVRQLCEHAGSAAPHTTDPPVACILHLHLPLSTVVNVEDL